MSKLTEVLKLFCYDPETDGNLTFNVTEALTKNWEKIDQLVLLAVAAAADYNPSGTYVIGDYCTNDGNLYKCNTPIESGETWNAAHWTETTVAAELAEVWVSLANKVSYADSPLSSVSIKTQIMASMFGYADTCTDTPYDGSSGVGISVPGWGDGVWGTQIAFDYGSRAPAFRQYYNYGQTVNPWTFFLISTPPQVRNLTLQSGFTADGGCAFWKTQESVVTVAGGVSGTLPGNKDTQIGVLQEGFRPTESRRYDATTNVGAAVLEIRMDGTVWMHPHEDAALCWFSAEFVTE